MTTNATPAPARPEPDQDSAPYWEALRAHRVSLPRCESCSRRHFPPTPSCPFCSHATMRWDDVSASGSIYSFITVHRAFDPAFTDEVPYVIATIDVDAGARMIGRLTGEPAIGARVEPEFVDHDDWTELRFRAVPR